MYTNIMVKFSFGRISIQEDKLSLSMHPITLPIPNILLPTLPQVASLPLSLSPRPVPIVDVPILEEVFSNAAHHPIVPFPIIGLLVD